MLSLKKNLIGHSEPISGIIELQSGQILSWAEDAVLKIWSLDNTQPVSKLAKHKAKITQVIQMPDGEIISIDQNGNLCVSDSKLNKLIHKVSKPEASLMGVTILNNREVVTWDLEHNLIHWDIKQGKTLKVLSHACYSYFGPSDFPPFILLPDKNLAITWTSISLEFWDLLSGECVESFYEHQDTCIGAILLSNQRMLSWATDFTMKIWTTSGVVLTTLTGHQNDIRGALELEEKGIVSWSNDNTVRIWNPATSREECIFSAHQDFIHKVWSVAPDKLLSLSMDGQFFLWNRKSGEVITEFQADLMGGVLISTNFFLGWLDESLLIWDLRTGKCSRTIQGSVGKVKGVKKITTNLIATWNESGKLCVWELS